MAKRSSIENLKRASRVKNSNMFAREHKQEYDPSSSPLIERPLATGRPLSVQVQGNAYGGRGLDFLRKENLLDNSKIPVYSPPRTSRTLDAMPEIFDNPSKTQSSPTKSSLSSKSRYAQGLIRGPEKRNWSDDEESMGDHELPPGKKLHRHAKSVTFDVAPPQINEYEMTTPDLSSVASGSREGSYESADGEEDDSFDRGSTIEREDSFDESLEDTDKTPVVLPEDWRFMSPATANDELAVHVENPFDDNENSPAPTARPSSAVDGRLSPTRSDSTNSNGERRPLPPLPALAMSVFSQTRSGSANGLSAAAERVSSAQRVKPSPIRPASTSKSEIQDMDGGSLSLDDRLRLMMIQEEKRPDFRPEVPQSSDSQEIISNQILSVERRGRDSQFRIHEDCSPEQEDYELPPRISRESILRKVKSRTMVLSEDDYEDYSPTPSSRSGITRLSDLDPDIPIPTLEAEPFPNDDEISVIIKEEDDGEESEVDIYSIPEVYSQQVQNESYPSAWGSSSRANIPTVENVFPGDGCLSSREGDIGAIRGRQSFDERSRGSSQEDEDDESHYSDSDKQHTLLPKGLTEDEGPPTPKAIHTNDVNKQIELNKANGVSLPQFSSILGDQDFGFGLETFLTPSPSNEEPVKSFHPSALAQTDTEVERPITPEAQVESSRYSGQFNDSNEPRTPDSVIRHPISHVDLSDSPSVPEPVATIKAPGSKLKTRPSVTPADIQTMAETRRQVSQEIPMVPSLPESHQSRPSVILESDIPLLEAQSYQEDELADKNSSKQPKRDSSLVQLELAIGKGDSCLGFGLDREFDRVIEAQKVAFTFHTPSFGLPCNSPGHAEYIPGQGFRPFMQNLANRSTRTQKGYLMRQNTKVVIATSASEDSAEDGVHLKTPGARGTRSAGCSPIKSSQVHPWTTEPWNGKVRRKSLRQSGGSPQKKPVAGPTPPLPGQQSNVASGLGSVTADELSLHSEESDDGGERGILFVKVVRVKDLDLPLPKGMFPSTFIREILTAHPGERSYFALTLDNGLHCVTTAWLELGKTAPIGQEFELIVLNDLEFQLTLQTKLVEPKPQPIAESPTKYVKLPKQSTFSRVFASPRKRKELEMKQQEEAQKVERQRQQDAQASKRSTQPTAWELLNGLVAKDGSFARSYVCLKDHESKAYGKPLTVDVPCFNEWATEEAQTTSSVKSKRSTARPGLQRRVPYKIGKLELHLLFVPKPKGSKSEDMPKSMNACIRELKEAEMATTKKWEGHLSQQGGDCPVGYIELNSTTR